MTEGKDFEPLVKLVAKKMREKFGQEANSSGFLLQYNKQSRQFNELVYFQDGGVMRSDGDAQTSYLIPPDVTSFELERAMKNMLKDPKIVKMKQKFSKEAQGQADYYRKRPMKNWPGI